VKAADELPIRVHFGAPRSGKSHELKRRLAADRPARLVIYDPRNEYGAFGRSIDRLSTAAARSNDRAFSIVFRPSADRSIAVRQFSALCDIAFERGHLSFLADELWTVMSPTFAPPGWRRVTREGGHQHLRIYCASQRPTEIDNGLFSLATVIRTTRLNAKGDRVKLADALDVDPAELQELGPRGWIERDMLTGRVTRG